MAAMDEATMAEWTRWLGERYDQGELSAMRRFWKEEHGGAPSESQWLRLQAGEPLQYVLQKAWFMGRTLQVNSSVLIPRPESEELVEWVLEDPSVHGQACLDLGTGSGCLALALAWRGSCRPVYGMDCSREALRTALENAKAWGLEDQFLSLWGDFMDDAWIPPVAPVWISNPPYIAQEEAGTLENHVIDYEPHIALFAPQGQPLNVYRRLAQHFLSNEHARQFWLELNPMWAEECRGIWGDCYVTIRNDMQGQARMLRVVKG